MAELRDTMLSNSGHALLEKNRVDKHHRDVARMDGLIARMEALLDQHPLALAAGTTAGKEYVEAAVQLHATKLCLIRLRSIRNDKFVKHQQEKVERIEERKREEARLRED